MADNLKKYHSSEWRSAGGGLSQYGGTGYSFSGSYGTTLYIYPYNSSSYNKYITIICECLPNTTYEITVTGDYHNNSTWLVKTMTAITNGSTLYDVTGLTKTYDSNTGLTTYHFTTGANANYVGLGNKNAVSNASANYPAGPRMIYKINPPGWQDMYAKKWRTEAYNLINGEEYKQGYSITGSTLQIYTSSQSSYSYYGSTVVQYDSTQLVTDIAIVVDGDQTANFLNTTTSKFFVKATTALTSGTTVSKRTISDISYDSTTNKTTFHVFVPSNYYYILIGNRQGGAAYATDVSNLNAKFYYYASPEWVNKATNGPHKRTSGAWD